MIAKILGFGSITGIELPFEVNGILPDMRWKMKKYSKSWFKSDTLNIAIGQGLILSTPIQLIQMIARIASQKKIFPTLINNKNKCFDKITINPKHIKRLEQTLKYDASLNNNSFYQLFGKTGTSQVIKRSMSKKKYKYIDHSIFTGYAKGIKNKYAISVVIEHGGWGSKTALPIAKKIFNNIGFF